MLYLNKILGTAYNSGVIQIDIPYIAGTEERVRAGMSPTKLIPSSEGRMSMKSTLVNSKFGGDSIQITEVRNEDAYYYVPTEFGYNSIRAFCTEDVTITLGNEWGSILPALNSITTFSQLGNEGNVVSWLSGTKASWKASKPLTIPLTFYVFSYSRIRNALNIIEPLVEFAGISEGGGWLDTKNFFGLSATGIHVHGGYRVQPFEDNQSYIESSKSPPSNNSTIKIHLGDKIIIDKLLLGEIQVTHSNVYVESGVPLYVKVQANFRTVGVPTIYDIRRWYGV